MMDTEQFLLIKLAEECQEVAQRALKMAQFGSDEVQKGQDQTNAERLYGELDDLNGITLLLDEETTGFTYTPSLVAIEAKAEKVAKYRALSEKLGRVNPKE
jgi:hypothetical protein